MVVSLWFAVIAVRVLGLPPILCASRTSSTVSDWPCRTSPLAAAPGPTSYNSSCSHYHCREKRVVPYASRSASRSVPLPLSLHETNCRFRDDDDEVSPAGCHRRRRRLTAITDAATLPGSRRWTRRSGTSSSRPGVRSRTRRRTATATATCARASGSSSCSCSSRTIWARTGWPRGFSSTSIPAFSSTSEYYRYRPIRSVLYSCSRDCGQGPGKFVGGRDVRHT